MTSPAVCLSPAHLPPFQTTTKVCLISDGNLQDHTNTGNIQHRPVGTSLGPAERNPLHRDQNQRPGSSNFSHDLLQHPQDASAQNNRAVTSKKLFNDFCRRFEVKAYFSRSIFFFWLEKLKIYLLLLMTYISNSSCLFIFMSQYTF